MIHSMPGYETSNYEKVLQIIFKWPAHQRFALVQEVLKTLAPDADELSGSIRSQRETLATARGLLAIDRTPPSDSEVDQWLDEHRMEKYG